MISKLLPVAAVLLALGSLGLQAQDKAPDSEKKLPIQKIYSCRSTAFDGGKPYNAVIDIFERGENVQKLEKIDDKGMLKVRALVDCNRFAGTVAAADSGPSKEDLAAAAAIARPGAAPEDSGKKESQAAEAKDIESKDEKDKKETEEKIVSEKPAAASGVAIPEDASFVITGNTSGLLFSLKSKPGNKAIIELIMTPEESGRFGKTGFHILMDQDSGKVTNLAWQRDGDYNFSRGVRSFNWTLKSGEKIFTLFMPWTTFISTIGELPVNDGRPVVWRFNVFRWAGNAGASFAGTPHDPAQSPFIILPRLSLKQIVEIQSSLLNGAINSFYEKKKGQATYFDYIKEHYEGAKRFNENFGLRMRLSYTRSYSERYLCENQELMDQYNANTIKIAQGCKELKAPDPAFGQHYEFFANWAREMENLRLQVLRDKIFSNSFGDE